MVEIAPLMHRMDEMERNVICGAVRPSVRRDIDGRGHICRCIGNALICAKFSSARPTGRPGRTPASKMMDEW